MLSSISILNKLYRNIHHKIHIKFSTHILSNYQQCIPSILKWNGDMNNIEPLILYEDNHLLVLYKPSCILMQGDMKNDENLLNMCKKYLQIKYKKPGSAYLGLVHRLDRVTSGVCVFAKTSKAASRLSSSFRNRNVTKYYQCVVNGALKKQRGELSHLLIKSHELRTKVLELNEGENRKDTISGVLKYNTLYSNQGSYQNQIQSLLAVELETGRKHQIRAQFSHINHPIVGDVKYDAPQRLKTRDIALHAAVLAFPHPTTHLQMVFKAPPPSSWEKRFGTNLMTASTQFNANITMESLTDIKSLHDVPHIHINNNNNLFPKSQSIPSDSTKKSGEVSYLS